MLLLLFCVLAIVSVTVVRGTFGLACRLGGRGGADLLSSFFGFATAFSDFVGTSECTSFSTIGLFILSEIMFISTSPSVSGVASCCCLSNLRCGCRGDSSMLRVELLYFSLLKSTNNGVFTPEKLTFTSFSGKSASEKLKSLMEELLSTGDILLRSSSSVFDIITCFFNSFNSCCCCGRGALICCSFTGKNLLLMLLLLMSLFVGVSVSLLPFSETVFLSGDLVEAATGATATGGVAAELNFRTSILSSTSSSSLSSVVVNSSSSPKKSSSSYASSSSS